MECIRCRTELSGPRLVPVDYVPTPHPSYNHMKTGDDINLCCSYECLMGPRTMIVAAACWIVHQPDCGEATQIIFVSARHFDMLMHNQIDNSVLSTDDKHDGKWEQGFIDQLGNYWSRTESWKIAEKNNQVRRRVGGDTADGGTLYSENLY